MKISFYKAVEADTLITNIFIMKKIFCGGGVPNSHASLLVLFSEIGRAER